MALRLDDAHRLGRGMRSVRASRDEQSRPLPSNERIADAIDSLTHAVTIRRPRRDVWPWLVQMGAGARAGWWKQLLRIAERVETQDDLSPFTDPDPADRSAFNHLFYRNRRPTWIGHWVSQFFCWWARVGLPPRSWFALEVRDRASGRTRSDAVVVPTVGGERYIVSMFGTISDRVHNLGAAHGEAVISHGRSEHVRLVLVAADARAPILREYVQLASSGRKHFPLPVGALLVDFTAIASQYPVYRIEVPPR